MTSSPVPDEAFWNDLYGDRPRWSGNPNPHLVSTATGLTPGRALDIGSGEGGDSIWLAQQGWDVTALELSSVALTRARTAAESAPGLRPVEWLHADALTWRPSGADFDLVSSQYSHFPPAEMSTLLATMAAATRSGGTLVVVGHEAHEHAMIGPEFFFAAADLAVQLGEGWTIAQAGLLPHPVREGRDEVLVAVRVAV